MKTYRIEWSIILDCESPEEAAKEAWAILDDSTTHNQYATVLFVEDYDGDGTDRVRIDMEHPDEEPQSDPRKGRY